MPYQVSWQSVSMKSQAPVHVLGVEATVAGEALASEALADEALVDEALVATSSAAHACEDHCCKNAELRHASPHAQHGRS